MLVYLARRLYRAKVPPWPSSSALKTMKQYLIVTITVRDQMIMDKAPTRSSHEGWLEKVDEKT
jgi:hypothetical protein